MTSNNAGQQQALLDMIAFCEERKFEDLASGLKLELKVIRKSSSKTLKTLNKAGSNRNVKADGKSEEASLDEKGQQRTLKVIMNALRTNERKKSREELKKVVRKSSSTGIEPPPKRPDPEDQN